MVFSFGLFAKLLSYARNRGCAGADMLVPSAPAIKAKIDFQIRIVPADGTGAAEWKEAGTSVRRRFWAALSQGNLLASIHVSGVSGPKYNGMSRN
jgi:hypothetical protein